MKRRTVLLAFGTLATGSGAISTTASLTDAVTTSSSFKVINPQELEIRGGQAYTDSGAVRTTDGFGLTESDPDYNYTNYYVDNASHSSFFNPSGGINDISQADVPVAAVNRRDTFVNENLEIQTAISILNDDDQYVFENILEIENKSGGQEDIAIKYENYYGNDVEVNSTNFEDDITVDDVQHIYQFYVSSSDASRIQISPEANTTPPEEPANSYGIDPTETIQLDLEIDLTPWGGRTTSIDPKEGIRNAIDNPGFTGGLETVDLLEAIEIGRWDS